MMLFLLVIYDTESLENQQFTSWQEHIDL